MKRAFGVIGIVLLVGVAVAGWSAASGAPSAGGDDLGGDLARMVLTLRRDGAALVDLARQSGAERGILWGHVHQAFDEERDGLRLMGTPSTCFQFSPGLAGFAIDKRPPGYRWLELHADGQIDTRIVWLPVAQDLA